MTRRGTVLGLAAVVLILIAFGLAGAQNKQPQTPDDKNRKVKREDIRAFQDWPKKDVSVIITAQEAAAYDKTAKLNIIGKVITVTEQRMGSFEETLTTTATPGELAEARERVSVYGRAVVLSPGRYRLDVLLRDVASGAQGFQQFAFVVPKFDASKLGVSSIVLAAKLESLKDKVPDNQFTIGLTKVVPNISGTYQRGAPVGVYLQVYNAGIDQTTLRPAADVEYLVLKDGKEISRRMEDWTGMSEAGQRLTLARLIDTRGLAPGSYEIQIRIRDHVTGQTLSPSAKFTVVP